MKLIIAGSRSINPTREQIKYYLDSLFIFPSEIVCGMARGVDLAGKDFAESNRIDVATFPANWDEHGKAAGHIRNKEMAEYGDALLLIWDGKSKGSANMKQNMIKLKKPVYEVVINET